MILKTFINFFNIYILLLELQLYGRLRILTFFTFLLTISSQYLYYFIVLLQNKIIHCLHEKINIYRLNLFSVYLFDLKSSHINNLTANKLLWLNA